MSNFTINDNHAKVTEFVNTEIANLEQKLNAATENFSNKPSELNELVELNQKLREAKRLSRVLVDNMSFSMTVANLLPHIGTEMDAFTAATIAVYVEA